MACLVLVLALLAGAVVSAVPSAASLNSDLTILINNDLQGPDSPSASSGVILLGQRTQKDAVSGCKALGEQLWAPELKTASIQPNLEYLVYEGQAETSSLFWIASQGRFARAINAAGHISYVSPSLELPVLCTQTAPYSNTSYADMSARWQVNVNANNEDLIGFRDRLSFRFQGIRYAPEPERFTYSLPYKGSGGSVSATEFGSACVQSPNIGSEDCLFLNIWTTYIPKSGSSSPTNPGLKPVMFWIHGGAFTSGMGSDPTFDGGNMASRGDVVLVTVNYRLTTLGFLALDDGVTNGNFGLADQINALDWVRENIQNFGGDPDRITVFGQSAGAGSVRALMASPKALGKFSGAIPESNLGGINYGTTYSEYYTIAQEVDVAASAILDATNCTDAASQRDCLGAVPAFTLANLATVARYVVVDGTYVTTDHLELTGPRLPVSLMMGTMRDDGAAFISYPATTNETAYLASQGFTDPPPSLFPIPDGANHTLDLYNMSSRLATDGIFRCIDEATVYTGVGSGRLGPVYYYESDRSYQLEGWPGTDVCEAPPTPAHPYGDPSRPYFKCHSGELYYVFGNLARMGLPLRDEYDLPFEQFVLDSWAAFARSSDPNPDRRFLEARGYANTTRELEVAGTWVPNSRQGQMKTIRVLDWPTYQAGFREEPQCDGIGLPLDYYYENA